MGRREACNNSSTMNTRYRSELESLQDTAATGNDNGRSLSLDRRHLRHTEENMAGAVVSSAVTLEVKKHQHKHNLKHRYEVMETLGKGTYGKVKKAVERATKKTVAIKSIRKETITDDLDKVHIQREIEITSSLKHPNIIRFQEVFESRDKIVIVMEYASQGELYDYVHERRRLAETEARDVFRQITSAVHYCHKKGVVHRDLKLENILLDKDLNVKLADFGLSNHFQKGRLLRTYCGSPLYASPEIVKGLPYQGPEVDCWAMGVLLYALLYGSMPFDGANYSTLTEQINQGRYRRPNPPSDACALIDWLLTVRVEERATVEDVANHWWVNWGYEGCVCDCVPSPHQDCPSPLLARYIDWQNRVTPEPRRPSSDLPAPHPAAHPAAHPFYFSFPLKGDRGGGGGRVRGGASSLRKSRKENTIPQAALGACGSGGATTASPNAVASESPSSAGAAERKKPKGILKPQRSFDSVFRPPPPEERSSSSQPCGVPSQPHRTNAQTSAEGLSSSLPTHSPFRHSSSKMPKKGILKNLYGGESGYSSSPETRGSGTAGESGGTGAGEQRGQPCSYDPHPRLSGVEDSPGMQTEAVRRRKGILKRNGKFSRSLDLPNDLLSSSLTSSPLRFPEALQRLLQATGGDAGTQTHFSRPASDDSLLSTDSFDLLDLSAQSRRRIFSQLRSTFSSEEDPENTGSETDRIGSGRSSGQGEEGEEAVLHLCSGGKQC